MMNQNQPSEMPQQMRDLAEKNVEQAHAGYTQLMDGMTQATNMWLSAMPANAMTDGFKAMHERSAQFAKQNADACFTCASELVVAKDVKEALAIQSRFAQTQVQAYTAQAQQFGKSITDAAQIARPKF